MRPFNLEEALAGKPVVTRDGRKVTEIYHFKTAFDNQDKVVGAVIDGKIFGRDISGRQNAVLDNDADLFMAPESIEVWVNVWRDKQGYFTRSWDTEEQAEYDIKNPTNHTFIKAEKITIEL